MEGKEEMNLLLGKDSVSQESGNPQPWGFTYMSDASNSDEDDRLLG